MRITTVGIDLANDVFQIHAADEYYRAISKRPPKLRSDGNLFRHPATVPDRH